MGKNSTNIIYVVLPLLFGVFHLAVQFGLPSTFVEYLTQEDGPYECLQFLIMAAAFIVAMSILVRFPVRAHPWLAAYIAIAAAGCFYIAGEEISWGQRIFGWVTPEDWLAVNDHQETNLHNTYAWADKVPRVILEVAICLGALPLALLMKYRPRILPKLFTPIYPAPILAVTAGCLLFLKIVKPLGEQLFYVDFERLSEVHEIYIYYFVLMYLISFKKRQL